MHILYRSCHRFNPNWIKWMPMHAADCKLPRVFLQVNVDRDRVAGEDCQSHWRLCQDWWTLQAEQVRQCHCCWPPNGLTQNFKPASEVWHVGFILYGAYNAADAWCYIAMSSDIVQCLILWQSTCCACAANLLCVVVFLSSASKPCWYHRSFATLLPCIYVLSHTKAEFDKLWFTCKRCNM